MKDEYGFEMEDQVGCKTASEVFEIGVLYGGVTKYNFDDLDMCDSLPSIHIIDPPSTISID